MLLDVPMVHLQCSCLNGFNSSYMPPHILLCFIIYVQSYMLLWLHIFFSMFLFNVKQHIIVIMVLKTFIFSAEWLHIYIPLLQMPTLFQFLCMCITIMIIVHAWISHLCRQGLLVWTVSLVTDAYLWTSLARFSSPLGFIMSLSRNESTSVKCGRWPDSFCQQCSINWCSVAGQPIGAGRR